MKLRTKFAIVLVAVMLVLSGVVLGSVELFKRDAVAQERADLADTATLTADQVATEILEKKETTAGYAARALGGGETTGKLRQFLNLTEFTQAQVVAGNGTVVALSGNVLTAEQRQRRIGTNVSDQTYFRRALEGRRFVEVLGPSQVSDTDQRLVLFSVPIATGANGTDRAGGVFVAGFAVSVDPEGNAGTNRNDALFASIAPQERDTQAVRIVARNVSGGNVSLRESTRSFNRTIRQTERITAGAKSGGTWTLTVVRDRSALDDRIRLLQGVQFGSLLLVVGAVLGMGYWEYSTNLTQTRKLLDGFAALQSGDFGHRLSLQAAEEWTQISDGFNEMATGLRERERAVREREQRLGVLNRVLRHNLQNDMTVILSYAEMVPTLEGDQQAEAVETILEKGNGLVAHGKKARKVEEAMESAEDGLVEHDLVTLVEGVLDSLRAEYPDARVESDLPDRLPVAGIESLYYAVESLCENALEHNDGDSPLLRVTAEPTAAGVTFRAEDDGPGIPDYERRVVAEAEETDLEHGSGLGLFLATWVTEKSGGTLAFDVDDGTTVTLSLQSADAAGEDDGKTLSGDSDGLPGDGGDADESRTVDDAAAD